MVLCALNDDGAPGWIPLLARCSFPPAGTAVELAVSGGADSLALLVLARAAGLRALAVHVDHGLRPHSGADAEVVAAAAERFGASFELRLVVVAPGSNLEARARAARYGALAPGVLTGHTADDQAETVLLHLLRGAGLDGLAGMTPNDRVHRPLLALRRRETAAVCAAAGLRPVEDPTNTDLRFGRNQVRHQLLPLLDRLAGRDVAALLARQAGLLADDAALLEGLAGAVDPCDAAALVAAPVPLARRALRRWLRAGSERYPPSAAEVDRVLAVARGEAVACQVAGGRTVRRSGGRLSLGLGRVGPGRVGPGRVGGP